MIWFKDRLLLVPFDFSKDSVEAARTALSLAVAPQDVHVLFVNVELPANDPMVIWNERTDDERAEAARQSMAEKLEEAGVHGVQLHVRLGDPGTAIAEFAKALPAGMIVMPSHGRRGLNRLLMGSVAERVVRLSNCPVLVLKQ